MLVAKQLIPAGTPGRVVVVRGMASVVTDVPAEVGAVPDPSSLAGRVASHDVFAGELVKTTDFSAARRPALGFMRACGFCGYLPVPHTCAGHTAVPGPTP